MEKKKNCEQGQKQSKTVNNSKNRSIWSKLVFKKSKQSTTVKRVKYGQKTVKTGQKRSKLSITVKNGQKRSKHFF